MSIYVIMRTFFFFFGEEPSCLLLPWNNSKIFEGSFTKFATRFSKICLPLEYCLKWNRNNFPLTGRPCRRFSSQFELKYDKCLWERNIFTQNKWCTGKRNTHIKINVFRKSDGLGGKCLKSGRTTEIVYCVHMTQIFKIENNVSAALSNYTCSRLAVDVLRAESARWLNAAEYGCRVGNQNCVRNFGRRTLWQGAALRT